MTSTVWSRAYTASSRFWTDKEFLFVHCSSSLRCAQSFELNLLSTHGKSCTKDIGPILKCTMIEDTAIRNNSPKLSEVLRLFCRGCQNSLHASTCIIYESLYASQNSTVAWGDLALQAYHWLQQVDKFEGPPNCLRRLSLDVKCAEPEVPKVWGKDQSETLDLFLVGLSVLPKLTSLEMDCSGVGAKIKMAR